MNVPDQSPVLPSRSWAVESLHAEISWYEPSAPVSGAVERSHGPDGSCWLNSKCTTGRECPLHSSDASGRDLEAMTRAQTARATHARAHTNARPTRRRSMRERVEQRDAWTT